MQAVVSLPTPKASGLPIKLLRMYDFPPRYIPAIATTEIGASTLLRNYFASGFTTNSKERKHTFFLLRLFVGSSVMN